MDRAIFRRTRPGSAPIAPEPARAAGRVAPPRVDDRSAALIETPPRADRFSIGDAVVPPAP